MLQKNNVNQNSNVRRTRQNRLMLVSSGKKKNQEVSRLFSKLDIKTPLNDIPLMSNMLVKGSCFVLIKFEMIS